MRGKITKRSIDALKAHATNDALLWDTEVKGFGFCVKPSGSRSFVFSYYAPGLHNVRRRLTIGHLADTTTEQARKGAMQLAAAVLRGEDPAKATADERRSNRDETVARLFPQYLDDAIGKKKPSTLAYYESLGRLYLLPRLGALPVKRVSPRDVAEMHRELRDKPTTANRAARLVRAFFYWLKRQHYFTGENPAAGTDWYPEESRERFLSIEEMARLGQALRVAETFGLPPAPQFLQQAEKRRERVPSSSRKRNSGMFTSELKPANPFAVAALRFLLFTGWRESEALTLRWEFIGTATGIVTLPGTKTGKSVRSLPAPAAKLLAELPRIDGSAFVFPGRDSSKPLVELQRLWYAVRHEAGLEGVRLHDLRHSVASFAGGRGYSLFLIGKLLGHKDQRSTARYAHLADDIRKTMADDVGELIAEALHSEPANKKAVLTLAKTSNKRSRRA